MSTSRTREKADGELFKSTGIDDNATSTAVTIDASENVLVGKTTIAGAFNTVGSEIRASGLVQSTVDGSKCIDLNRLSSDGDILGFSKAGTSVGSIGTYLNASYIMGSGNKGIFLNGTLNPAGASGGIDDNTQNIGASNRRWKDLYLSGGVYLGGTGAANKLQDYETGTWTPAWATASGAQPTVGYSSRFGHYVKIGRLVTLRVEMYVNALTVNGATSAVMIINGLPFAMVNQAASVGSSTSAQIAWTRARSNMTGYGATEFGFLGQSSSTGNTGWGWERISNLTSSSELRFTIQYETNA